MKGCLPILACLLVYSIILNAQDKPKKEVIIPDSLKNRIIQQKDIEVKPEEVVFSATVPSKVLDNMPVRQPDPSIKSNMPCLIAGKDIKYNMPEYTAAQPDKQVTVTRKSSEDLNKPLSGNPKPKKEEKK